jgi:hypothetical protein
MAVRLSALRADRPSPPPLKIPGTHFSWRLSRPQGHSAAGRIRSIDERWKYIENIIRQRHDDDVTAYVTNTTSTSVQHTAHNTAAPPPVRPRQLSNYNYYGAAVTLSSRIREVLRSNLGRVTGNMTGVFVAFLDPPRKMIGHDCLLSYPF